jgi:N6-L-threonylcarbamoyladenine synthase
MLILGIETSCDETSVSLLEIKNKKTKVLSNIVSSQMKLHAKFGGVVPALAAREHVKNLRHVLSAATKNIDLKKIDLIAVTAGPGLVSSLFVGTTFAKTLAWKLNKPIVGVNHTEGHIYSNWLPLATSVKSELSKKIFPALCLTVSGGHTQLSLMARIGKYKIVGETLDDAAGEAFDKIARLLNLGYPGGPAISIEAEKLKNKKLNIKLPRPMINAKNFNFSFAGLKTAVLYMVRDLTKIYPLQKIRTEIAHEAQNAIVDTLISKTMKAAERYKARSIMLSGGVSANKLLRSAFQKFTKQKKIKYFQPEMVYTTDNAAMIAMAGYFNFKHKKTGRTWRSVIVNSNLTL